MIGGFTRRAPGYSERRAESGRFRVDPQLIIHEGAPCKLLPASQIMLTSIEAGGGMVPAVMMTLPGGVLAYTMDAGDLRSFGQHMIDLAEKHEREADEAAAAALRKAAGK